MHGGRLPHTQPVGDWCGSRCRKGPEGSGLAPGWPLPPAAWGGPSPPFFRPAASVQGGPPELLRLRWQVFSSKLGFLGHFEICHSHFSLIIEEKGKRGEKHHSFSLLIPPLGLLLSPCLQFAPSLSESFPFSLEASLSSQ